MDLKQALDIVLELALDGMVGKSKDEFAQQSQAMTTVHDFLRAIREDADYARALKAAREQGIKLVPKHVWLRNRKHNPGG